MKQLFVEATDLSIEGKMQNKKMKTLLSLKKETDKQKKPNKNNRNGFKVHDLFLPRILAYMNFFELKQRYFTFI